MLDEHIDQIEGCHSVRDFLLEHELKIQQMLRQTIRRAHELGDFGTVQVLEEVLVDREDGMTHLVDGQNDMAGNRPMNPNSKLQ